MENVVLIIHLLLALGLIAAVLLQRSEGGLGSMGGGGGGAVSARSAATAMGKLTWFLAIGFICTSIALTIIAAQKSASGSVVDRLGVEQPATEETGGDLPALPAANSLLPPSSGDLNLTPSAD